MDVMKRISIVFVFLFLFFIIFTIVVELERDQVSEEEYTKDSHGNIISVVDIRDEIVLLDVIGGSFLMEEGEIHSIKGSGIYNGTIEILKVSPDRVLIKKDIEKTYRYYILMSAMSAALTFISTYIVVKLSIGSFRLARAIERKLSK